VLDSDGVVLQPNCRSSLLAVRRALLWVSVALLPCVVAGVVVSQRWNPADVRGSSTVEFEPLDLPTRLPTKTRPLRPSWPTYGFDARRLRVAPSSRLRPPFKLLWTFHGGALLEFPPAIAAGRLYLPTFDGRFYALDAETGKTSWRFDSSRCSWASPAIAGGVVYQTFLNHPRNCNVATTRLDGEVVAFDTRTGRVRWRRRLEPTESSPLVAGGAVYVGDWGGSVSALDARTGRVRWRLRTDAAVKGSVAAANGRVFVGSYDGHVYAADARTGRQLWRSSGLARLGGAGRFYSTPAVAYGRVYIGSTDGRVYSFGAASGKLRWAHATGGYVYSSPAVWRRLILIGSYDGWFYALDAATGDLRWRFHANGSISGSPSVVAGEVYFSTLRERTYALDARSGRLAWSFPDGKYSPVVVDEKHVYLVGYGRLFALVPVHGRRR
jgi:outer membrane protein assembly factor BamB